MILGGCKSTPQLQDYRAPAIKLRAEDAVFLSMPADAHDEPGSGRKCAEILLEAFTPYAHRLKLSHEVAILSMHLANVLTQGFSCILESKIYRWEEEPTEWTGKPDVLDIGLRLYRTRDGELLSEIRFGGKSKWATFGGDHVEHPLKPLADEWVRSLYEATDFKFPGTKP